MKQSGGKTFSRHTKDSISGLFENYVNSVTEPLTTGYIIDIIGFTINGGAGIKTLSLIYRRDTGETNRKHGREAADLAKIIALANQKGGVGKTTSAVNIAAAIGVKEKRVLLIDSDPQGNTSSGVGINKKNMRLSTYDVLINRAGAESVIVETGYKNLWIMPANISLAGAEFELVSSEARETRLRNALVPIKNRFDYIFIDCPPSLGILTVNALTAADGVIVPMQCEYYALEGLSQLLITIKQVKKLYNPALDITGILITMYNGRLNLSLQVMDELKKYYAGKLFATTILRNVRLSEAPGFGMPIQYFDRHSKGTEAYNSVADEIMERI